MRRFKAVATAIVTLMTGPGLCQTPLPPADHAGFADAVVKTGRPIIRSDFDVYLEDKVLVYVKDVCREEDIRAPFFLHVTPVDRNDLPADRLESGFERTRFRFERDGFRRGGPCILTYRLPDYPIRRLRTGQSAPETDRSWEAAHPPNLVFIMADDLGKGLLPLYNARVEVGTPNIERLAREPWFLPLHHLPIHVGTPNIERLAREGIVFDNAYATPVCLTTRAELITGRYPRQQRPRWARRARDDQCRRISRSPTFAQLREPAQARRLRYRARRKVARQSPISERSSLAGIRLRPVDAQRQSTLNLCHDP